jgi:class 3 adenylate cyclase/tetratricopeptide (TPR) repeat protein
MGGRVDDEVAKRSVVIWALDGEPLGPSVVRWRSFVRCASSARWRGPGGMLTIGEVIGERGAGVERSTAIVVFTDLVGSTELRSRVGEDAAEELRRKHDRLIGDAIEANRGRLVKHLGDGVMATFTGASDGLAAAVGIQQALDRHNRSSPSAVLLEVRIGVSAGDVAFEEVDCFGTPVIEAARLCAAAGGGKILVTEVVRLLAGTGGGHQFTPLGALDLKGLPAPVPACEVTWEPQAEPSVPMPALLTGVGRVFVGRGGELERLSGLWKEATAGERRVALLAGEPGIGKTRLATELAEMAQAAGALVLAGRCDEDLGVPFQPFVEALHHYVAHASEPRLGRYGGELTRLLPELAGMVPGLAEPVRSDPETERYRLFDGVAAWLADVSAEAPVLLVLDDVHWAAKPTLLLLRHVLRSAAPLRLLVVATYRDSEVGRGHLLSEFFADLRRVEGVERFPLTGLDQGGVAAFIEAVAGHALLEEDEGLPRAVWAETEGNPFFVAEVLRHLSETGGVEYRAGRWITTASVEDLGIPEGVRDVVGRRLSRLSETANRALRVASVTGLEFEPAVIRSAADLGDDELYTSLEEAVAARLLTEVPGPVPRYRFAHALVRATLYDEVSAARRAALHQKVAEAIETVHAGALDNYLPALAHHWARSAVTVAQAARAIDYATRAGDRALAQLAHDEAAAYYRQALELLDAAEGQPQGERRLELLIALGEAQRRAGDPAHRDTLLGAVDLARVRGDADALARAALANCRLAYVSSSGVVDQKRVAALEAALEAVGDVVTSVRARLLASLGVELVYSGQRERRVALSDEALALARTLDDPTTLAHVLLSRFFTINAPSTLPERLANTAELLILAEELDDPLVTFVSWFQRARVTLEAGDLASARSHLEGAEALAADLGQLVFRWMALWTRLGQVLLAGQIDEADRLAEETFEVGRASGQPDAGLYYAVHRFLVRFEQGRLDEIEPDIVDFVARLPAVPGFACLLGLIHSEAGRLEEARTALEPLASRSFQLPEDVVWLGLSTVAAEGVRHLGDRSGAAALYDLLLPYAGVFSVIGGTSTGCTSYYLGMLAAALGRYAESEQHFRDAAGIYERIGAPAHLGRTFVEWARMLLARRQPGDAERARQLLDQALTTARELGLVNVERRAVGLLT